MRNEWIRETMSTGSGTDGKIKLTVTSKEKLYVHPPMSKPLLYFSEQVEHGGHVVEETNHMDITCSNSDIFSRRIGSKKITRFAVVLTEPGMNVSLRAGRRSTLYRVTT